MKDEKKIKELEKRLTSNEGDVLILDEKGKIISKDNLRNEALKKLKKYQDEENRNGRSR